METVFSKQEMESLFYSTKEEIEKSIYFLTDKPEETVDSTIKACWHTASGNPKSSEEAIKYNLPVLTNDQIIDFKTLIGKRLNNIPLAHLTGRKNFIGVELLSDSRALIPRKETEILARKALDISYELTKKNQTIQVMDVCCGAGNLGLAMAFLNTNSFVYATDLSFDAVALTNDNIDFLNLRHRVSVFQGDLFSAFENAHYYNKLNLIICNPPYISSAKVSKMHREISDHEPYLAFDGGKFGTDIIQKFLLQAPSFLAPNGWIIFEVGVGQGSFVLMLCERSKLYIDISYESDELGNIRVVFARIK